jgi:hypothetical protein
VAPPVLTGTPGPPRRFSLGPRGDPNDRNPGGGNRGFFNGRSGQGRTRLHPPFPANGSGIRAFERTEAPGYTMNGGVLP